MIQHASWNIGSACFVRSWNMGLIRIDSLGWGQGGYAVPWRDWTELSRSVVKTVKICEDLVPVSNVSPREFSVVDLWCLSWYVMIVVLPDLVDFVLSRCCKLLWIGFDARSPSPWGEPSDWEKRSARRPEIARNLQRSETKESKRRESQRARSPPARPYPVNSFFDVSSPSLSLMLLSLGLFNFFDLFCLRLWLQHSGWWLNHTKHRLPIRSVLGMARRWWDLCPLWLFHCSDAGKGPQKVTSQRFHLCSDPCKHQLKTFEVYFEHLWTTFLRVVHDQSRSTVTNYYLYQAHSKMDAATSSQHCVAVGSVTWMTWMTWSQRQLTKMCQLIARTMKGKQRWRENERHA